VKGLRTGMEMIDCDKLKRPNSQKAEEIVKRAFKKGLILTNVGTYHQVVRITPPLNVTRNEVEIGLNILEEVLQEAS
jgi:4-aminobutyrate aminotransferase